MPTVRWPKRSFICMTQPPPLASSLHIIFLHNSTTNHLGSTPPWLTLLFATLYLSLTVTSDALNSNDRRGYLVMAASLDDLIDHLLDEVAICGENGR